MTVFIFCVPDVHASVHSANKCNSIINLDLIISLIFSTEHYVFNSYNGQMEAELSLRRQNAGRVLNVVTFSMVP